MEESTKAMKKSFIFLTSKEIAQFLHCFFKISSSLLRFLYHSHPHMGPCHPLPVMCVIHWIESIHFIQLWNQNEFAFSLGVLPKVIKWQICASLLMPIPSTRGIVVVTGFKAYTLDCRIPFLIGLHVDFDYIG